MTSIEQAVQDDTAQLQASVDQTRKLFLAAVKDVRPKLHRFCTRMCGSVLDGEDLVQEALAHAFYSLSSLKDTSRLEPWLFRIAHHKCVDFLRRDRRQREDTVPYFEDDVPVSAPDDGDFAEEPVTDALVALVGELPPMERACVLLKDVLGYRLTEIAAVVDSTLGGVKAALHRGRAKLRAVHRTPPRIELDREQRDLLEAYLDCFNRCDWDALRRLIAADARLEVVGVVEGSLVDFGSTYFSNYGALPGEWRFSLARVDGEPMLVYWRKDGENWRPLTAARLWWRDNKVVRIRDYGHVAYLLKHSRTEEVTDRS